MYEVEVFDACQRLPQVANCSCGAQVELLSCRRDGETVAVTLCVHVCFSVCE